MGMILQYVSQVPFAVMDPAQSRLSYIDLYIPNKVEKNKGPTYSFCLQNLFTAKKNPTGKRRLPHFLLHQEMRQSEQPLQRLCGFAQKLHSLSLKHRHSLRESWWVVSSTCSHSSQHSKEASLKRGHLHPPHLLPMRGSTSHTDAPSWGLLMRSPHHIQPPAVKVRCERHRGEGRGGWLEPPQGLQGPLKWCCWFENEFRGFKW